MFKQQSHDYHKNGLFPISMIQMTVVFIFTLNMERDLAI